MHSLGVTADAADVVCMAQTVQLVLQPAVGPAAVSEPMTVRPFPILRIVLVWYQNNAYDELVFVVGIGAKRVEP